MSGIIFVWPNRISKVSKGVVNRKSDQRINIYRFLETEVEMLSYQIRGFGSQGFILDESGWPFAENDLVFMAATSTEIARDTQRGSWRFLGST